MSRARGRPRKFDEDKVIHAAGQVFWQQGFDGTSLDDLAAAMEMNRPSIYRAFGDKETLYRRALEEFGVNMERAVEAAFSSGNNVAKALETFFLEALGIYTSGDQPKGCLVMSTAVSAAVSHPDVKSDLLKVIKRIDKALEERFLIAVDQGQLPAQFDASGRAAIAQSVLHSISIRARAGDKRVTLNRLIKSGVELVIS